MCRTCEGFTDSKDRPTPSVPPKDRPTPSVPPKDSTHTNASRLVVGCYVYMALASAARGGAVGVGMAVALMLLAVALRSCNDAFHKMAYAAMSLATIAEGRFFGALGYALAVTGAGDIANKLLAFHYGLVALDSDSGETVMDRVAASGAMLNYAL